MQMKCRNYPYPVLDYYSDNFVNCTFQTAIITKITKTAYVLEATSITSSRDLRKYIEDDKACYALYIECPTTMYRQMFKSKSTSFTVELPVDCVEGKVQICPFIVAVSDIENYSCSNFHSDFAGLTFNINKGDVLAIDKDSDFDAMKEADVLRNIASIFSVKENKESNPPVMDVNILDNKIEILMSPQNYKIYTTLKQDTTRTAILSSMIVIPALVHIVDMLKNGKIDCEEYEDRRWFRALKRRMHELGLNIENIDEGESAIVIANKLVGTPIDDAFKVLSSMYDSPIEEE